MRKLFTAVIFMIILGSLTLLPLVNANWHMFHSNPTHDGVGAGSPVYTLTQLWNYTTGSNVNSSPAVVEGVVYVASYDDNIYALNATNGEKIWNYDTGSATDSSPAVVDGVVYVAGGDRNVYGLNASDGTEIWSFYIGNGWGGSPTVSDGVVYIGTDDDYGPEDFFALNASTGQQLWNYSTGWGGGGCPALVDGVAYFGSGDGYVYALNASNGQQIWSYTAPAAQFLQSPAVVDGVVYIAITVGNVGSFYALNATSGNKLWNYNATGIDNYVTTTPAVSNDVVYICSRYGMFYDGNVHALNACDGTEIWKVTAGSLIYSSPAIVDEVLYLGSGDGNVYALDATNGAILSNYTVDATAGPTVYSSPAVVDGVVYIGSCDHRVYALAGSLTPPPIKETFEVIDGDDIYFVETWSNSTVSDFTFDTESSSVQLNATADSGTAGFCNVTVPQDLIWGDFSVYLDEMLLVEGVDYTGTSNDTHNLFYMTYNQGSHIIEIVGTESVPEFPSIIVSFLIFAAILLFTIEQKVKQKKSS
jgi:outer membrane protein assembly factor BamB